MPMDLETRRKRVVGLGACLAASAAATSGLSRLDHPVLNVAALAIIVVLMIYTMIEAIKVFRAIRRKP